MSDRPILLLERYLRELELPTLLRDCGTVMAAQPSSTWHSSVSGLIGP